MLKKLQDAILINNLVNFQNRENFNFEIDQLLKLLNLNLKLF